MSSSENFDLDVSDSGSESDDYAPAPKKTTKAVPKAKPAPNAKAPAKPKTARKKVQLDKDDNADSDSDDDDSKSDDDDEVRAGPSAPPNAKTKTASETYTKLSQIDHILKRPDSYIGSIETITQTMWAWDSERNMMVYRDVKYVPGFFKIVDEILVNAADNKINDPSMDTIKVTLDAEHNTISVHNNGRGIPVEMHSKEKMYIPELIFGHLLSSSNYDDDEKKLTGGRNGYGAKLANIYSTEFTVETADKNTGLKYIQTWTDNMSKMGEARITKNTRKEEYTRVTFKPDLKRFAMDRIDEDMLALLKKRVHDIAGTVKDVKVYLNDERLKIKNFKQYVDLYLNSVSEQAADASGGAVQPKQTVIYEQPDSRWEIAFVVSEGTFQQVSFANSISTVKGGTHVTLIADQIAKSLISSITKKNKAATIKPAQIKNHMWVFVNALIENPTFDSQTKETLTLPASKFGTKPSLSEDFMKKVQKSSIVDHVLNWAKFKADQQMKKTDGSRRTRLSGLPKLSDANNAGTKKAKECTLILTEGDSAKTLAVAGFAVVGRDNYGVFPLRGKMLNVRDAKHDQIMKNEEIQNIKKILGLQHNKEYKDVSSLRYGRLMIMTDQDHDGSHIKGLVINYLDHFYPSLLKIPGFLVEFITPIVRVRKGDRKIDFYTLPEFEQWLEETPGSEKWVPKYFKGLGTSTDADGREYFSNMRKHMIPFNTMKEGDRELIELAFSKKRADDRKEWLRQFKLGTFFDHTQGQIPLADFINKELILFSMADNVRSIPSVADGLKPGQRKVIWACFKRKLKTEIKVAQLVGYISEHAAYHHGEQSLTMTIVNLAQNFVGSNNMNLLKPNGQFGTRDQGGKDHASARYIFTEPSPITRTLLHPEDDALMNYLTDDGKVIEPEWYLPVVPLVLVNGAEGIGTGWSTNIPTYNPEDIVANIRRLMAGEKQVPMLPWWRGFRGTIKKVGENKYDVFGNVNKIDDSTIEITELPIHKWTQSYKAELEVMCGEKGDGVIKDYKEYHGNTNVHFVVSMDPKNVEKAEAQGFHEFFKLITKISTSNMICYDFDGKIKKYNSAEEIIDDCFPVRLAYYQKRKDYLANELQTQLERLNNQARFVQMIVDGELVVSARKKVQIIAELREKQFRPFSKVSKAKAAGEVVDAVEDEDEVEETTANTTDFDYLLGMPIYSLTREKIEKLRQQSKDKEAELLALLELTPAQIWETDLNRFLAEWKFTCEEWENDASAAIIGKGKGKRKQATLKTFKKEAADGDDGSDDDFKPAKAAAKSKKPTEPKPAKKPTQAVPSESKVKLDDDDDIPPPPKKAMKKEPVKVEDDSDIEMFDSAPAPKMQAAKEESDSDIEIIPENKAKGKVKAAPTTKRKSSEIDGDDSDDNIIIKPAKKNKSGRGQASVTDFFDNLPAATAKKTTARKPSSSALAGATKGRVTSGTKKATRKVVASDHDEVTLDDDDELLARPPPKAATRKTSTTTKTKAVESGDDVISIDEDELPVKKPVTKKSSSSKQTGKAKAAAPAKKKKIADSDDEDMFMDDDVVMVVPKRSEAPKRAVRATAKTSYVEIASSDGEGDQDGSEFEDFD